MGAILALLIGFYYRYSTDKNQIRYLEDEKSRVVQELAKIKADVDRYAGLNEVYKLELEDSKEEVSKLLDSVGKLNFTIAGLRRDLRYFNRLKKRVDSLQLANQVLMDRLGDVVVDFKELEQENNSYRRRLGLDSRSGRLGNIPLEMGIAENELTALDFSGAEISAYKLNLGRPVSTDRASDTRKLRACVSISENSRVRNRIRRSLFIQFMAPDSTVIIEDGRGIQMGAHTFSRKVDITYTGDKIDVCDAIDIPEAALAGGTYTLHIYENGLRRVSTEIQLK
jgi:hypothetical protein